ncbi:MAG: septal ring lytic transglycosylase RlpA family protein [Gammaproteobacteria bacterium]
MKTSRFALAAGVGAPVRPPSASNKRRPAYLSILLALGILIAGCGGTPTRPGQDGGPGTSVDVSSVPDAVPRVEPRSRRGNPESYVVFGKRYYVMNDAGGYLERGIASWYGKKFHGRTTSSGEIYDMYAMTAAHKSLPLPTYVQVTNLENQRSVVVKVNDRGPFHSNRIIDLSYTAAAKLDIVRRGTGLVEVRAIDPNVESEPLQVAGSAGAAPGLIAAARVPTAPAAVEVSPDEAAIDHEIPVDGAGAAEMAANGLPMPVAVSRRSLVDVAIDTIVPAAEAAQSPAPPHASGPLLYLQLGAFAVLANAERLASRVRPLAGDLVNVYEFMNGELTVYRVRVGPLESVASADALSAKLLAQGLDEPRVVVETQ